MSISSIRRALSLLALSWLAVPCARAQFAVIDIASVTQLISEARTLEQQLTQAQAQLQSMTGTRGMQSLLAGIDRNYLPTNWPQLSATLQNSGGTYGALAADIQQATAGNAVLSGAQLGALPAQEQQQLGAVRQAAALLQALTQEALVNSSGRFTSMQQLINTIGSTGDQKSILELTARIGAEQGMLQNEQTKLQVLYQTAQAQDWINHQRERELIVAGHGQFQTRFEPAAP